MNMAGQGTWLALKGGHLISCRIWALSCLKIGVMDDFLFYTFHAYYCISPLTPDIFLIPGILSPFLSADLLFSKDSPEAQLCPCRYVYFPSQAVSLLEVKTVSLPSSTVGHAVEVLRHQSKSFFKGFTCEMLETFLYSAQHFSFHFPIFALIYKVVPFDI